MFDWTGLRKGISACDILVSSPLHLGHSSGFILAALYLGVYFVGVCGRVKNSNDRGVAKDSDKQVI